MAVETHTYNPLNLVAGDAPIRTLRIQIKAGELTVKGLSALTPMKLSSSTGLAGPCTTLGDNSVGLLVPDSSSTAETLVGTPKTTASIYWWVYTHIDIFGAKVDFTAISAATSNNKKLVIFVGTGINLVFPLAGQ